MSYDCILTNRKVDEWKFNVETEARIDEAVTDLVCHNVAHTHAWDVLGKKIAVEESEEGIFNGLNPGRRYKVYVKY